MSEVIHLQDWIEMAPWRDRAVSFLRVDRVPAEQATHMDDKRAMLSGAPTDAILVLWTGRYRTEARRLTVEEHDELVIRLG